MGFFFQPFLPFVAFHNLILVRILFIIVFIKAPEFVLTTATVSFYPKYLIADTRYGSFNNYLFCQEHGMEKYMKFPMHKKETKNENITMTHSGQ